MLPTDTVPDFPECEALARAVTTRLQQTSLPLTAVELVLRPARLYDKQTFGWTLYAFGFGRNREAARARWIEAAILQVSAFQLELVASRVTQNETRLPTHGPAAATPMGE